MQVEEGKIVKIDEDELLELLVRSMRNNGHSTIVASLLADEFVRELKAGKEDGLHDI